jgi:transposase
LTVIGTRCSIGLDEALTLKESNAARALAECLADFLPGSGAKAWMGHVTFASVAARVGVSEFWASVGSKTPRVAQLLEGTLQHRRERFEPLILGIVREGLRYTTFCDRYREWLGRRGLVMRQVHLAGDKAFVDYSGKKPKIVDPATGEVTDVELFVAALGASNLTYAEATYTQRGPDWIASHVRAFEYFGGVPAALVPDQLKSGVTRSCRYEPEVQCTYEELTQHYGTTVLPARPAHPRDKGCASHCTSSVGSRVVSYDAADLPRVLC